MRRDAFTLLEVLVSLVILGVLSALMSFVLHGAMKMHQLQQAEPHRHRDRASALARGLADLPGAEPALQLVEEP